LGLVERRSFALQREGGSRRSRRAWPIVARILAIAVAAALSGCGSISQKFTEVGSQLPGVGLSASAPERTAEPAAYPAVHDIPAPRNSVTLTNPEQAQLQNDLVVARDVQQEAVGVRVKPDKNKKTQAPQGKVIPVSSRSSIY
jgi:hypothetical protein